MKLYDYSRSSAAHRVRIALGLKGLAFDRAAIDLRAGAQRSPAYLGLNPQGFVPTLVDGEVRITQSLAAVEYLDEMYPAPPLLPVDAAGRARVRALAEAIACDLHPLQNLCVRRALGERFGADERAQRGWARDTIREGLLAWGRLLAAGRPPGRFAHGDAPGLADLCLVPQLVGARRYGCDLSGLDDLLQVERACLALEPFQRAAPEAEPDAADSDPGSPS